MIVPLPEFVEHNFTAVFVAVVLALYVAIELLAYFKR